MDYMKTQGKRYTETVDKLMSTDAMATHKTIEKIDVAIDLNRGELHIAFVQPKRFPYGFAVPLAMGGPVLATFCMVWGAKFPSSFRIATSSKRQENAIELKRVDECSLGQAMAFVDDFVSGEGLE
jgi:hypothetical protein